MIPHPPRDLVQDMLRVCARLSALGFTPATDGNVSARISDTHILCTPTALAKGEVRADDLVVVAMDGTHAAGSRRASTEVRMHLEYYRQRMDVRAVVHAHPVHATAWATAGRALDACVFPEVIVSLGTVPLAAYATPSTEDVPLSIAPFTATHDAVLLANHGVVTAGASLATALHRMEKVEHTAHVLWLAETLGGPRVLSREQVQRLLDVAPASYGVDASSRPACNTNLASSAPSAPSSEASADGHAGRDASPVLSGISELVSHTLRELGFTKD